MDVLQWLFWQMAGLGPMAGQIGHFNIYASEKVPMRSSATESKPRGSMPRIIQSPTWPAFHGSSAHGAWPEPAGVPNLRRWFEAIRLVRSNKNVRRQQGCLHRRRCNRQIAPRLVRGRGIDLWRPLTANRYSFQLFTMTISLPPLRSGEARRAASARNSGSFPQQSIPTFALEGERLVGAGRAFGDEVDCAVICDMAVIPEFQGGLWWPHSRSTEARGATS